MSKQTTDYRLQTTATQNAVDGKQSLPTLREGRLWTVDSKKGFTLIEILVAIAIMSVVFGLIISSSSAIRKRARDQQRITDLQNLQQALVSFYADQNFFPDANFNLGTATQVTDDSGNPLVSTISRIYLAAVPKDPQAIVYHYLPMLRINDTTSGCNNSVQATSCQYYIICASSESQPASPSTLCPAQFGVGYNYQVDPNHSTTL